MPVCKNCGARIEKFNKDMCPICGCKNPLEGISSDTIEVTSDITNLLVDGKKPRFKTKKKFILLTYLCSFLGINFFYLSRAKVGLLFLLANIVFIGGLFALFNFIVKLPVAVSIIIPFVVAYLIDVLLSYFLFNKVYNHKDGKGSFLK